MALPKINRLSLRLERERLNKEGKTYFSRHFTLISAPQPSLVGAIHESPISVIPETDSSLRGGIPTRQSINIDSVIPGTDPESIQISSTNPRFAILLSKKTAKLAVDRNLIKRRTSSLIAENLSCFSVADYLLIPKRSVLDTPYSELLADFLPLLQKLK